MDYWRMRRLYALGVHRNVRQLITLQNKLKITYDKSLSVHDIEEKIKETYRQRLKIKRMAESLSLEYRSQLAAAKEAAGQIKAATYIRSLNQIERQRKLFQNIRFMEKKIFGGSTSKVTVTNDSGDVIEYTDKSKMEEVIANEKSGIKLRGVVSYIYQNSFKNWEIMAKDLILVLS